jgi:hypothetical protein
MQNIKGYIDTFDDLLLYKGDQLQMKNPPEPSARSRSNASRKGLENNTTDLNA